MSIKLSDEIVKAIKDEHSIKVLASNDKDGIPHVTVKNTLTLLDDGRIIYYELLESSQTQRNLVYSIWFKKQVAINVITKDAKSYLIKGTPYKAVIAGQQFEKAYLEVQDKVGKDIDLSTIWIIEPEEAHEETFAVRREIIEKDHPYVLHLDRIAKE
ncbi:MAG: pyridoxamine 5'-phosphate oxidase family protein [Ruminiclostridium sp.]